jgi:hypothetical protein
MERGGFVTPSIRPSKKAIRARILRLLHYMLGHQSLIYSPSLDSNGFEFWILKYCENALTSLGASSEDIKNLYLSMIAKAHNDLSKWKHGKDEHGFPAYGM